MVETHGVAGDSKAQIRAAPHHGWATPLRWLGTARCPRTRSSIATGLEAPKVVANGPDYLPFYSPSRMVDLNSRCPPNALSPPRLPAHFLLRFQNIDQTRHNEAVPTHTRLLHSSLKHEQLGPLATRRSPRGDSGGV